MAPYTLLTDGDRFEKSYENKFLSSSFPEYEQFWQKHVIPLTNRPSNIHFKDNATLSTGGFDEEDVCIAQLHYTILRHLGAVYDLLQNRHPYLDELTVVFSRLVGAQDVAFELLERYSNRGTYDPWLAIKHGSTLGSREAKQQWQRNNSYPLQAFRNYRNHLVHGRMNPGVVSNTFYFPAIGDEEKYFDWRTITSGTTWQSEIGVSLLPSKDIVVMAWDQTLDYFRTNWNAHLLP